MIEAQIDNAIGISHFFVRNKTTGKFERITDPDKIEAAMNAGGEYYRIYTKDPSEEELSGFCRISIPD